MRRWIWLIVVTWSFVAVVGPGSPAEPVAAPPVQPDPAQSTERTSFQTSRAWSGSAQLGSDVAIVYGLDAGMADRIKTWRDKGYRVHVMTGVSWGSYQDYIYGRFDGTDHQDEAQMDRRGHKISHGGDVYYMCPGTNFGRFLAAGVQRALDAGVDAIHLEEPEFWVRAGYSEGFKREWRAHYGEDWRPPEESADAQWRGSKLKYFLYRRALQQVFEHVQEFNRRTGRQVKCYVPTHSLLNYAHWRIVSPESSLARLKGCDGYIAQVWTGTARTPNIYRGLRRERTFETAFLEYGAMQNLVRATGRRVWYLNDPIEDNAGHDWTDYQQNWESTLVASLFQPEVWRYEVAPWPERVFEGRYPQGSPQARTIPPPYATELQTVFHALHDLNQPQVEWDCGTAGLGVLISDTLMFERGASGASDPDLGHIYGLALPFLKRGMPVAPVQLENITLAGYLDGFRCLLLTYQGMKPMGPEVHGALAQWVRAGGLLVVCDDDTDPYNAVREWWNSDGRSFRTPREDLFQQVGATTAPGWQRIGRGKLLWLHEHPASLARSAHGDVRLTEAVRAGWPDAPSWRETNFLLLRRGPYVVAAGLDEASSANPRTLRGKFVNLFDPALRVRREIALSAGTRFFLIDLAKAAQVEGRVLASAGHVRPLPQDGEKRVFRYVVDGVTGTPALLLLAAPRAPESLALAGQALTAFEHAAADGLLWVRFPHEAASRELTVRFR